MWFNLPLKICLLRGLEIRDVDGDGDREWKNKKDEEEAFEIVLVR